MITRLVRPLRHCVQALFDDRSPRQIAWGVALGVMVGLMPKGNLIAIFLAVMLFSLRINLAVGLVTAALFSLVGMFLDPITDHLGRSILTIIPLQGLFARLYELPTVPWTQFNNTVVMGSFVLGALQLYPTYRLARGLAERHLASVLTTLGQHQVTQRLAGSIVTQQGRLS